MFPSRIVIHLDKLRANYRRMVESYSGLKLAPVIKADAYGHGIVACARALEAEEVPYLSVFTVDEARELRDAGVKTRLILLGGALDVAECGEVAALENVAVAGWNLAEIRELSCCAVAQNRVVDLHLKIDSGMSRLGFFADEVPGVVAEIASLPGLVIKGAFTHLASADCPEKDYTARQSAAFAKAVSALPATATEIHESATPGMLAGVGLQYPIVRPGFTLYGYGSDLRTPGLTFEPVMDFTSKLISLKTIPVGAEISYGGIYRVTDKPRRIAVIPVGYADGYPRTLGNQVEVLVRGRRAPIRGRVCMGMMMADVTDIPDATVGDEVVLLGSQGAERIDATELAQKVGSIPYELLCNLGKNPNRVFV